MHRILYIAVHYNWSCFVTCIDVVTCLTSSVLLVLEVPFVF